MSQFGDKHLNGRASLLRSEVTAWKDRGSRWKTGERTMMLHREASSLFPLHILIFCRAAAIWPFVNLDSFEMGSRLCVFGSSFSPKSYRLNASFSLLFARFLNSTARA